MKCEAETRSGGRCTRSATWVLTRGRRGIFPEALCTRHANEVTTETRRIESPRWERVAKD